MPVTGALSVTYFDYDGEPGVFSVNVPVLSAANFDAQATLRTAFVAAVQAITLGELNATRYGNVSLQGIVPSEDPDAQREDKWRVDYHDATSLKRYRIDIPTCDDAQLDANDRKHAHIGDAGVVDAFVDAFEAYVITPDGGASVVDEITRVGRNV